jgi:hypothetical protein
MATLDTDSTPSYPTTSYPGVLRHHHPNLATQAMADTTCAA